MDRHASTSGLLLILIFAVFCWAEESGDRSAAGDSPRISFDGLEKAEAEQAVILGTLFKTRTGDFINFVPVQPGSRHGVWTRSLTDEVKAEAIKRVEAQTHVPVLATCKISVTPGRAAPAGPVRTGVYLGPVNNARLTAVQYLSDKEASDLAAKLVEDESARKAFLMRLK